MIESLKGKVNSVETLAQLRTEIDQISLEILHLLNKRAEVAKKIGEVKSQAGTTNKFDPVREQQLLLWLVEQNEGPLNDETVIQIFKEIFKVALSIQEQDQENKLLVTRNETTPDTIVQIGEVIFGGETPVMIAGPCAIESEQQVRLVAKELVKQGVHVMRGGAYKPRTSPYDFQGLGLDGLKMFYRIAKEYDLVVVTEIMDELSLQEALPYLDIVQIGTRNMQNFSLLKAAGQQEKPVLLKRGMSATVEEWMYAAEYIMAQGNKQVILCERGIRTYENATRNTLDISAVPLMKQKTHLPIFVDVTHAAGRKDIMLPLAKAAIAAGANGIMIEVHPLPSTALSDAQQQLDFDEFGQFMLNIENVLKQ
ncbi:MAG: bifunctional 3-deoxy-7-phosphoheptulonate synthase/chorismate mutase [Culicoidibacterales bacterium]